jgi:hypothetical protein
MHSTYCKFFVLILLLSWNFAKYTIALQYRRGHKKRATSGKFYLTLNERKTYFEITFMFFLNRL